jgi:hypothetical protein
LITGGSGRTLADPPGTVGATVVRAGALEATLEGTAIRWLRYAGVEVLRGLDITVRDQSWGTVAAVISELRTSRRSDSREISLHAAYRSAEIDFEADARISLAPGRLHYEMRGIAQRTFFKNRIGLIALHPMGVAGQGLTLETTSGRVSHHFPEAIDPGMVATDVAGMRWSPVRGVQASLRFEGDRWEIEDQRNWIDASFKTFPTPLREPFPVEVAAGTVIEQSVTLELSGRPGARKRAVPPVVRIAPRASARLPAIGVADAGPEGILGLAAADVLRTLRVAHVRAHADLDSPDADDRIAHALDLAGRLDAAVELDIDGSPDASSRALDVARRLVASRRRVVGLNVFSRASKSGFDSTLEVLAEGRRAMRTAGLVCPLGGGTRANFTELNRARTPGGSMDVVTYAVNPQVHAFDDASIVETLQTIPLTVRQARAISANRPVSLVVTLKPRFNSSTGIKAVPADPAALPARVDLRQPGPFAAAWTVGALAAVARRGTERVTWYETVGMAGLLADPADPLHPAFPTTPGSLYPIFGVLEALTALGTSSVRTAVAGADVAVLAVGHRAGIRVLAANLRDGDARLSLAGEWPGAGSLQRLSSAPVPLGQPIWSVAAPVSPSRAGTVSVPLGAYEVVRMDWGRPARERRRDA